ncbi:gamma-glutamylcyclotransferase [Novosphingobium sp. FSY-8]|uniref:Gamma-glutamylcyclotransferase n=1 Tax=Novosphingobium ovatum TaxID=1908523 RepID=A0ABW9XGN0_9SPHN|nr:gamma-glutamylcyclotransferase family protein [Novosphingobium ovatum]NBC37717.1 gamma-glutamylcyclotransferase [Novosphingobium ovatum]
MILFFYGTLIAGSGNAVAARAHDALTDLGRGWVAGALYALPDADGWYPALVAGQGRVWGRLYDAPDGFDLGPLDAYEGAEYARAAINVTGPRGRVGAQAYLWAGAVPADAVPLPDGDFAAHAAAHGWRVYGA